MTYSSQYKNSTTRVTSRLARKEQKKLSRQTFGIIFISIVMLLLFIFVLLPGGVRLFFNFLDSNTGLETSDNIPPQIPILSAPVEATFSASIRLSGFAEPNSEVVLVLEGQKHAIFPVSDDGSFEYDLSLNEGENSFVLYGIDKSENTSNTTRKYVVVYDNEAPTISLESPKNDEVIESKINQVVEVIGTTEPNSRLFLNDRLIRVNSDGSFSTNYNLVEGENELKFKAIDRAGNEGETSIKVIFRY